MLIRRTVWVYNLNLRIFVRKCFMQRFSRENDSQYQCPQYVIYAPSYVCNIHTVNSQPIQRLGSVDYLQAKSSFFFLGVHAIL